MLLYLVLLPPLYVLSMGPAEYFDRRGWLPAGLYDAAYHRPLAKTRYGVRVFNVVHLWVLWWGDLGDEHERHAAPD